MKKLLTIDISFNLIFISIAPVACKVQKDYHVNEDEQVISKHIDFNCDEEFDHDNKVEGTFDEHYPKTIDNDCYKIKNCILQNFNKASQTENDAFVQFTTNHLIEYQNFDQINQKLILASKNIMDLNRLLVHIKDVANFKAVITFVYNVLAKLVGEQIAPYLIFNLVIVKQFEGNTLAVTVGISDQIGVSNILLKL